MAEKVLTVDDSKTIRMIVKKAFKPYDCELFEGENGVEGLAIAAKEKPDLIVLDITMPVMSGIEMLEKLKSEPALKNIPVIMLTAESGKDNVMQIVKMGVKDYMVKPFKGDQLIERAAKLIKLNPKIDDTDAEAFRHFSVDGDFHIFTLPAKINRDVNSEAVKYIKTKTGESSDLSKLIMNIQKTKTVDVSLIRLILTIIEKCKNSQIHIRIVGSDAQLEELKGFQETAEIPIYPTVEEAISSF